MDDRRKCNNSKFCDSMGIPGVCQCSVCYPPQQGIQVDYARGGRGQLREGDLRSTAEEGVSGGRPTDNYVPMEEKIYRTWPGRVYRDTDFPGGRGDRPMTTCPYCGWSSYNPDCAACMGQKMQDKRAGLATNRQVGGAHYRDMAIQVTTFIEANDLGWCEGNAIKYICRHHLKGGEADLDKAIHYLEVLKELKYDKESEGEAD